MTIKAKVTLLGLIPVIALLYIAQYETRGWVEARNNLKEIHLLALITEKISNVIHELQRERGRSVGLLSYAGRKNTGIVSGQRSETDKKVQELEAFVKERRLDSKIFILLSDLSRERTAIDSERATVTEAEEYYSGKISALIDEIAGITQRISASTRTEFLSHLHLLYIKEALGRIRATLYASFISGSLDSRSLEKLVVLKGNYDTNIRFFLNETPDDVRDYYARKVSGETVRETMDTIDRALGKLNDGILSVGADPDRWFESATVTIDLIKEVEDYCMTDLKRHTAENLREITTVAVTKIALILGILIAVFSIAVYTIKSTFTASDSLQSSITTIIETKDFNTKVAVTSNDEIGFIAHAFNNLLETVQQLLAEKDRLAAVDPLTQIFNRLEFDRLFQVEVQRSLRYKTRLSLIMFDIDLFKRINDTYGHQVGDSVLVEMSGVVMKSIRSSDVFARWGGEEFVIFTPETFLEDAGKLAEKIRREIEGHHFGTAGSITCSFGVAELKEGDNMDTLSKKADTALYEAKRSGRNRVCCENGPH